MKDPRNTDLRNKQAADALAAMTGGAETNSPAEEQESLAEPVANPNVFGRVHRAHHASKTPTNERSIHTARTLIPILLTLGVGLGVIGSMKWVMGSDSPFAAWPMPAVAGLFAIGACLLMLAVFNMLHVRHLLQLTQRQR